MKIYWIYDYLHQRKFDKNFNKLNYLIENELIDSIQLRIKNQTQQTVIDWAKKQSHLIKSLKPHFTIYMNDYPDIAHELNLTGVHIGKNDTAIQTIKKRSPQLKLGYTCHNIQDIYFAQKNSVDYLGCGTVFSSPTKTNLPAQGINFIKEAMKQTPLPIFPIGGIHKNNIEQLSRLGIQQVAISSALFGKDFKEQAHTIINA